MDVKLGTKAWNNTAVEPHSKGPVMRTETPKELEALGGASLGEVLNKTADPNWIDPSKKIRAVGSDKMGKDAFMKLMLAQMKNQDPTNPLKSHEMAAQLAQFSSLEQLQNINTSLDTMKSGQKPQETMQALNYIGKAVAGDSANVYRSKGDVSHDFIFNLPEAAQTAELVVKNANGEPVRKITLKDLKKGENNFTWNGVDDRDQPQAAGDYQFSIEAKNSSGKKLAVKTDFSGQITGVNYTNEGPVLLIGNQAVRMKDVKRIIDPALLQMKKDQPAQNATGAELKMAPAVSQTDSGQQKAELQQKAAPEKNEKPFLPGVAMTRGLLNDLQEEKRNAEAPAKVDAQAKTEKGEVKK